MIDVLSRDEDMSAALVPHVIRLLAWEPVADHAMFALQRVAEERIGQLIDALIDPNQDFAVRRRLARVFAVCVSQRAADGLLLGLDDVRFEVRFHCARSLSLILEKNPRLHINRDRVFDEEPQHLRLFRRHDRRPRSRRGDRDRLRPRCRRRS